MVISLFLKTLLTDFAKLSLIKNNGKLEVVQKVLRFSTPIREWCINEFSVHFDDFDEQNVDDYNSGGYGEIADEILERGLNEQLIEEDDLD